MEVRAPPHYYYYYYRRRHQPPTGAGRRLEEQAHSQQSPSSNAVSRPQPQLSRPSQRLQLTSTTSRPLPPQPTGIPPPHREYRLKLRINQAVYLQSVSTKTHTIYNRALIVARTPHIGDPDVISKSYRRDSKTQCIIHEATFTTQIAAARTARSQPIIVDTAHLIA
jgi:hypothetical protein